ncbi:MAG TPA: hypothetical protein VEH04_13445 [Verrucomicrobiae bacterium]|nr:hypothetical protein [Verrucomicrobiae bacterium]
MSVVVGPKESHDVPGERVHFKVGDSIFVPGLGFLRIKRVVHQIEDFPAPGGNRGVHRVLLYV